MIHESDRMISQERADFINRLLMLNSDEIYALYGFKRDEVITEDCYFDDGSKAEIRLIICEDDKPYTEGILYQNGREVCVTDPDDEFICTWDFEDDNGNKYIAKVTSF